MSTADKLKDLRAIHSSLEEDFTSWSSDYKSLAKHFLPRKCRIEGRDKTNDGGLRTDILDGTGIRSVRVATAGMHGGMTSPARPWFSLSLPDQDLAKHYSVRPWLDEVGTRMRNLLARSNFYMAIHNVYQELVVFGTSFMFEHVDMRTGLRFNALTIGEYVLDTDEHGRVNTIFRTMEMTAKNIVRMFGLENCSETVKRSYENAGSRNARFAVVHAVLPREDKDPSKLNNLNMPFASYYYEKASAEQRFLRESGYEEFPGFGTRWDVTGQDTLGRSPAMDCLGDVRELQSLRATYLKQEHKRADPPTAVPHDMQHANLIPGGTTAVKSTGGRPSMYPVYQVTPDPTGILAVIQDVRLSVREGLYNDLFKMLALAAPRQKTATEVAELHEEKLLQLGPVLERLHDELFTPQIDRTFSLMLEADMVPQWPEEIQGMPLKVDFVSLLAQAQKMVATSALDQFMGFIGNYSEIKPELLDIPNADKVGDSYAEYLGVEAKMITSQDERDQAREQRAQNAQKAQMSEAVGSEAQTAKTMAETPMGDGSNALEEIMKGMGGAQ